MIKDNFDKSNKYKLFSVADNVFTFSMQYHHTQSPLKLLTLIMYFDVNCWLAMIKFQRTVSQQTKISAIKVCINEF